MKFYKLGLLTLLISLFILSSCKTQDGIGLDVDPANELNGTLIADTGVVVNTVKEDSIVTNGLNRTPLSYFKDPALGTTTANIAAVLNLPGGASTYTLPTGTITIDSARLVLPYATDGFYGDSLTSSFKLNVHQLADRINTTQPYYNTKHVNYNSTIIGTKTFFARAHDSIIVADIRTGKADSIKKVVPQLRIAIDPGFINTNLFNAPTSTLSSAAIFQNTVKGLYLTLDSTQTTGPGGNIIFNTDSASVTVYYKVVNGTTIDTASLSMPLSNNVSEIRHNYSTQVKAALNNTSTDGLVYLQGLAGLRAKVSFPNIKDVFNSIGGSSKAIINRAELVLKVNPGTATPYNPVRRLAIYTSDLARQRINISDVSLIDPGTGNGYYNPANGEYHFIVTKFIQNLLLGKSIDYGTYIAPVDPTPTAASTAPSVATTAEYAERAIIAGKNSPYRIKLNIIYTKINQ